MCYYKEFDEELYDEIKKLNGLLRTAYTKLYNDLCTREKLLFHVDPYNEDQITKILEAAVDAGDKMFYDSYKDNPEEI